jgi:amino acid permease
MFISCDGLYNFLSIISNFVINTPLLPVGALYIVIIQNLLESTLSFIAHASKFLSLQY